MGLLITNFAREMEGGRWEYRVAFDRLRVTGDVSWELGV
jgi:hypothetical protein